MMNTFPPNPDAVGQVPPNGARARLYEQIESLAKRTLYSRPLSKATETQGGSVVATYADWGVSGQGEKPQLTAVIEAVARGEFDVLIMRDLSRFGRNLPMLAERLECLLEADVAIWSLDQGTDPANDSEKLGVFFRGPK